MEMTMEQTNQASDNFFSFPKSERVALMTLPQLQQTLEVKDRFGNPPRNRPERADVFIEKILELMKNHNIIGSLDEIIIQQEGFHPILAKDEVYPDQRYPLNKLLIERLIARIVIPNEFMHPGAIALSYTEKGIQIGFGLHVAICSNMCIMGTDNVLSTYRYGEHEPDRIDVIFIELEDWLRNFPQKFSLLKDMVEKMMEYRLDPVEVDGIIGKMAMMSREKTLGLDNISPFNSTQFDKLLDGMVQQNRHDYNEIQTMWEFYMACTNILKPENFMATDIISCNQQLGEFLLQEMG